MNEEEKAKADLIEFCEAFVRFLIASELNQDGEYLCEIYFSQGDNTMTLRRINMYERNKDKAMH